MQIIFDRPLVCSALRRTRAPPARARWRSTVVTAPATPACHRLLGNRHKPAGQIPGQPGPRDAVLARSVRSSTVVTSSRPPGSPARRGAQSLRLALPSRQKQSAAGPTATRSCATVKQRQRRRHPSKRRFQRPLVAGRHSGGRPIRPAPTRLPGEPVEHHPSSTRVLLGPRRGSDARRSRSGDGTRRRGSRSVTSNGRSVSAAALLLEIGTDDRRRTPSGFTCPIAIASAPIRPGLRRQPMEWGRTRMLGVIRGKTTDDLLAAIASLGP